MSYPINLNIPLPVLQQAEPMTTKVDYIVVSNDFCNLYYTTMLTRGISGTLSLFKPTAICINNEVTYVGMYDLMSVLSTQGISKFLYNNLHFTPILLDSNNIMIQVTGQIQFMTFWNQLSQIKSFSETFILSFEQTKLLITKYILKIIN